MALVVLDLNSQEAGWREPPKIQTVFALSFVSLGFSLMLLFITLTLFVFITVVLHLNTLYLHGIIKSIGTTKTAHHGTSKES
jgi:hypothetical protein